MQNERETAAPAAQQAAATGEGEVQTLGGTGNAPPGMSGIAAAYLAQSISGANWFMWVAALSMINSIISLVNGSWSFLAGLGITQVIDGIAAGVAQQLGGAAMVVALLLDVLVAGFFVGLGLFARKQQSWAFIVGMVVYALDAVIFIFFGGWLSVLFHAYVMYRIYQGFAANNKLKALQAEVGAAGR